MFLAAPLGDRLAVEPVRDRDDAAHVRVGASDLLDDQGVGDQVEAHPAVLLRQGRREEAELGELGDDPAVDRLGAIPLGRVRRDLGVAERPRRLLDQLLLVGEREVHAAILFRSKENPAGYGGRFRPPHRPTDSGLRPSRLLGGASTYLRAAPCGSRNV